MGEIDDFHVDPPAMTALRLKRDEFSLNRHPALAICLNMIFPEPKVRACENRFPLFGIMP
jgi:hypothetical protein